LSGKLCQEEEDGCKTTRKSEFRPEESRHDHDYHPVFPDGGYGLLRHASVRNEAENHCQSGTGRHQVSQSD
jgi:hypothetical protein